MTAIGAPASDSHPTTASPDTHRTEPFAPGPRPVSDRCCLRGPSRHPPRSRGAATRANRPRSDPPVLAKFVQYCFDLVGQCTGRDRDQGRSMEGLSSEHIGEFRRVESADLDRVRSRREPGQIDRHRTAPAQLREGLRLARRRGEHIIGPAAVLRSGGALVINPAVEFGRWRQPSAPKQSPL